MAKTDPNQDSREEPSLWRTGAVLVGILILVFGIYYLANGGERTARNDKKVDQAKQESTSKSESSDKSKSDSKQNEATLREAKAAAQRGESVDTVAVEDGNSYRYVAGNGESYTGLARRAVSSFDSKLSDAERVAAETKLTQDAGADLIDAGQEVSIGRPQVEQAVKWAKSLSDQQKAAWQPYADMVAW